MKPVIVGIAPFHDTLGPVKRCEKLSLEVGVRGEVEGTVAKEGTVTVNAKKLYDVIREVPNELVQIKRLENDWVGTAR